MLSTAKSVSLLVGSTKRRDSTKVEQKRGCSQESCYSQLSLLSTTLSVSLLCLVGPKEAGERRRL